MRSKAVPLWVCVRRYGGVRKTRFQRLACIGYDAPSTLRRLELGNLVLLQSERVLSALREDNESQRWSGNETGNNEGVVRMRGTEIRLHHCKKGTDVSACGGKGCVKAERERGGSQKRRYDLEPSHEGIGRIARMGQERVLSQPAYPPSPPARRSYRHTQVTCPQPVAGPRFRNGPTQSSEAPRPDTD